jgi:hypothetical protein
VAHVAEKVEKLTVRDKEKEVESTTASAAKIAFNNKTSTATAATSIINNIAIDNQATMTIINNTAITTSMDGSITNNKAGTETPNRRQHQQQGRSGCEGRYRGEAQQLQAKAMEEDDQS